MEESGSAILSPYQAQGVSVTLRMLERILFSVEQLCTEPEGTREGIMVSVVNPLTPEERAHLAGLVLRARAAIERLAGRFGFEPETADLAKEAHGRLVEMWANLEDTRSHKLRRYGSVNPALSPALDPEIEELIYLVLVMDKVLFHHGQHRPVAQADGKQVGGNYDSKP